MSEIEMLERLDRLITALETPKRLDETLWNVEQIAQWFGLSKVTIEKRVVTRPGFPAPTRAVDTMQAQRRWFANEIVEWARANKGTVPSSRPGRRRRID